MSPPRPGQTPAAAPSATFDTDTLVGLRTEDLGHAERRALIRVLSSDPGGDAYAQSLALARAVSELPAAPSELHAGHVLRRLAHRRRRKTQRALAAAIAVGLTTVGVGLAVQPRGVWSPATVTLEASALLDGVKRRVRHGADLPRTADLQLALTTAGPGALFVQERWGYDSVRPIAPVTGRWEVDPGLHAVTAPIRSRTAPTMVTYEAWLCPPGSPRIDPDRCSHDRLLVDWR